uniref:Uncharacterized protein n=1 Tax=Leersia perrieri TaxID=77586 RepID=A0A0D9VQP5_9ORYZ
MRAHSPAYIHRTHATGVTGPWRRRVSFVSLPGDGDRSGAAPPPSCGVRTHRRRRGGVDRGKYQAMQRSCEGTQCEREEEGVEEG